MFLGGPSQASAARPNFANPLQLITADKTQSDGMVPCLVRPTLPHIVSLTQQRHIISHSLAAIPFTPSKVIPASMVVQQ
jgi:hypothetical protein